MIVEATAIGRQLGRELHIGDTFMFGSILMVVVDELHLSENNGTFQCRALTGPTAGKFTLLPKDDVYIQYELEIKQC